MTAVTVGQRVSVRGEPGVVRFVGLTQFAPGEWVGVELDQLKGRNDGSVQGIRYFECQNSGNFGVFIRAEALDHAFPEKQGLLVDPEVKNVVNKLQLKLKNAVMEILRSKDTILALNAQMDESRKDREELEANLEQSAVELEYLRTHNTELVHLLEILREKYDDLYADFLLVSEELEIYKELEKAVCSQASVGPVLAEDYQTLLQHNKKLELALSGLKKATEDAETSKMVTMKLLREKTADFSHLNVSYRALEEQNNASQLLVKQLQEQLEDSAELSLIIEYLTSENETLQAKIADLTQFVNELSELHEMDKVIEEDHVLAEKEFQVLVETLKKEIGSHKKHLSELQTSNSLLLKELSNLKKRLESGHTPLDSREYEELTLETKKAKTRAATNAFVNSVLRDTIGAVSDIPRNIVPSKYMAQIETIVTIAEVTACSSALLAEVQELPPSSLRVVAEHTHLFPKKEDDSEELNTHISSLKAGFDTALSRFVPSDLYSLDLSFSAGTTELTESLQLKFNTFKSAKAEYIYSCLESEISVAVEMVKHISKTCPKGTSEHSETLAKFVSEGEKLLHILDKRKNSIAQNQDREMSGYIGISTTHATLFSSLCGRLEMLESEIGLESDKLSSKFDSSIDFEQYFSLFKEWETHLLREPHYEEKAEKSIYDVLSEQSKGDTHKTPMAVSNLEAQLVSRTQDVQNLQLQIELLEKNMNSAIAGKDAEISDTHRLLTGVEKELLAVKEHSDELVRANRDLQLQLGALRSAESKFEFPETPVFEGLKAMKEYTATMALVDEIQLLKRVVRVKGGMHMDDSANNWLYRPLCGQKNKQLLLVSYQPSLEFLQAAQNKRKDAFLLLQAILGNTAR